MPYTLITGSSEGLGKALAIECARRGRNLILVALPGPELYALMDLLKANYAVDVVCIAKDLCRTDSSAELYEEVVSLNLKIDMLINNAGLGGTLLFEQGHPDFYEKQIRLNVLGTTLITRRFLPLLQENTSAYILNVGSLASFFYLPKKQVYGATKSFIYSFSKSLQKELKKQNVKVSILCPGGLNTNPSITLINRTGNYLTRVSAMNPEEVAPIAINGLVKGKSVIIPGKLNKFFLILDWVLPPFFKRILMERTVKKLNQQNPLSRHLLPATKPVYTAPIPYSFN